MGIGDVWVASRPMISVRSPSRYRVRRPLWSCYRILPITSVVGHRAWLLVLVLLERASTHRTLGRPVEAAEVKAVAVNCGAALRIGGGTMVA